MQTTMINLEHFPQNLSYLEPSFSSECDYIDSLQCRINNSILQVIPLALRAMQNAALLEIPNELQQAFEQMIEHNEMLGIDVADMDAEDDVVIHPSVSDYYEFNNCSGSPCEDLRTYLAIKGLHTSEVTTVTPSDNARVEIFESDGRFAINILPLSVDDDEAIRFRLRFFVNKDLTEIDLKHTFYTESFCERVVVGREGPILAHRFDNLSKDDFIAWSHISQFTQSYNHRQDLDCISGLVDTTNQLVKAIFQPELHHDFEEINQYIQDMGLDYSYSPVHVLHDFPAIIPKILATHPVSNEAYIRLIDNFAACLFEQHNHRVDLEFVEPIFDELLDSLCHCRIAYLDDAIKIGEFVHEIDRIKDTLNYLSPSYKSLFSTFSVELEQFHNTQLCSDLCHSIEQSLLNTLTPSQVDDEPESVLQLGNSL
ncbi:hypothetical protein [Shewanella aestuarii]|uniref:Uncharacterized protein n=1 Tax=Shewanella aestuarii TaxID=1028752 RepID=A0A6G9QPS6_9GAMM|nr:hypothetical protein [Shewanella aestuarii]QIR16594.1 hypothetical protein HBH39_19150 [Shewanella aestuarii]